MISKRTWVNITVQVCLQGHLTNILQAPGCEATLGVVSAVVEAGTAEGLLLYTQFGALLHSNSADHPVIRHFNIRTFGVWEVVNVISWKLKIWKVWQLKSTISCYYLQRKIYNDIKTCPSYRCFFFMQLSFDHFGNHNGLNQSYTVFEKQHKRHA